MTKKYRAVGSVIAAVAALCSVACGGSDANGNPDSEGPVDTGDKPGNEFADLPCDIHTDFAGDDICIQPPPEDKGFQLHYGPSSYDDPDEIAKYTLDPGGETNVYVPAVSGNATDVYFYKRQYRMRRGSHHLIVMEAGGAGGPLGTGRRLGGSQNPIKDNPEGEMPPENEGIGMPLAANTALSLNLHHYNGTEGTTLKEAWVNFWYVDPATVTKQANEMFLMSLGETIPPNAHVTVTGERPVTADGRILTTYGHRHSNNIRFTAYRERGDEKVMIYDDYNWEEPAVLEYNTVTTNAAPNPESHATGGYTGILDLKAGDKLTWECEIVNKSGDTIIFNQNEAITSEMCILVGDTVDVAISTF
jgi:hypothetical protein